MNKTMKKILALVVAVASMSASAQVYLGGSLGVMRNSTEKTTQLTIAPEIGYSFSSKTALGGAFDYSYNYIDGESLHLVTINPYFRYTFCRAVEDRLGFFFDTSVGVGFGSIENYKDTPTVWNIGFKPGISYSFNEHFSVVAHMGFLGYQGANDAAKLWGYSNKFGLDFSSLNLSFGFYYSF